MKKNPSSRAIPKKHSKTKRGYLSKCLKYSNPSSLEHNFKLYFRNNIRIKSMFPKSQ